jgi:hypothetical protein
MGEPPKVIGTAGGPIDETRVTLAVYGDDLDPEAVSALEAAIAAVTRALTTASGEAVVVLAAERAALRAELALATTPNVVAAPSRCGTLRMSGTWLPT